MATATRTPTRQKIIDGLVADAAAGRTIPLPPVTWPVEIPKAGAVEQAIMREVDDAELELVYFDATHRLGGQSIGDQP